MVVTTIYYNRYNLCTQVYWEPLAFSTRFFIHICTKRFRFFLLFFKKAFYIPQEMRIYRGLIIDNIHTWHTISVQTNHDLGSRLYCMIEYVGKEVKHLQGGLYQYAAFSLLWIDENYILSLSVKACIRRSICTLNC